MKTRTILFSVAGVIVAMLAIDGAVSLISARDSLSGPLDLAGIKKLHVTGTASDIMIAAKADAPQVAELTGERHGWGALWRSSWFSGSCPAKGSMRIDGDMLTVDVGRGGRFFDWSYCTMTLTANLQPGASVSIDQQAARTRLDGEFSALDIRSDAGDIAFTGHAASIAVSGAALRARLTFERVMQTEAIMISGTMLDATVRFLQPTPISYLVETVASYVDSALPNTPGARPSITIRGEMARVRIE
ncbi:hypothetical protein [Rhizobium sp. SL42]|uniref:hypothetical protein n=1 Tax=Rhizobium sp. SL42 TaxID=2806346 RepID=UPI001F369DDA|nr:hypothetical protein [Rhizobium sp. SL42]UJW76495.1 hypothetical protein IM739_08515 [Rhizobium sp. SL42]